MTQIIGLGGQKNVNFTLWDINQQYRPGDMVVYNNIIYTVTQNIPAGTPFGPEWSIAVEGGNASFADEANVALNLDAAAPANLKIGGGNVGEVLTADSAGNLIWAPPGMSSLPIANGTSQFDIPVAGSTVEITSNTAHTWSFGNTGTLITPGNIQSDGTADFDIIATDPSDSGLELSLKYVDFGDEVRTSVSLGYNNVVLKAIPAGQSVTYEWNFNETGNLIVPGAILPVANILQDLGSPTQRFRDLYLSNNTIHLGDQTISANTSSITLSGNVAAAGMIASGNVTIAGNLTVSGNTTQINVTDLHVQDPIIFMGGGANGANATVYDGKDRGILLQDYYPNGSGVNNHFFGWKSSTAQFEAIANVTSTSGEVITGTAGNIAAETFIGNLTGTVLTAAQTNITSVGTLTGLAVSGSITTAGGASPAPSISGFSTISAENLNLSKSANLGNVANITITGGSAGEYLQTDGAGNLVWTPGTSPAGANTEVQFNDNGVFGAESRFTYTLDTSTLQTFNLAVTNTVSSDLIPSSNVTFDLGSDSQRWKDLWLSNTTIHLGDQSISSLNGNVAFNGNITATQLFGAANTITDNAQPNITSVGTLTSLEVTGITDLVDLNASGAVVLNGVTITEQQITTTASSLFEILGTDQGVQLQSLDTANSTFALVFADNTGVGLVTDAGEIIVGIDGNVTVTDSMSVGADLTVTGTLSAANGVNLGNVANITIEGGNAGEYLQTDGVGNLIWTTAGGGGGTPAGANTEIQFNDAGAFGANSTLTFDKTTGLVSVKDLAVTGNITTALLPNANVTYDLGSATQRWKDLYLSNNTIYMGDQTISANATHISVGNIDAADVTATNFMGTLSSGTSNVAFSGVDGNVLVNTTDGSNSFIWSFGTDGNLTLPLGGTITETSVSGAHVNNTIALTPSTGTSSDQQLLIYPTGTVANNHIHLTSGNLYNTELFLGNDSFHVKLANTGIIVISTDDNQGNSKPWVFGTDGSIIYPTLDVQQGDSPSGVITAQTMLFGGDSILGSAVISTLDGTSSYTTSQRLIINPGQGYEGGDGGDICLWAGRGGNASGFGGDIAIKAGHGGNNTNGGTGGDGGDITIEAGSSASTGGNAGSIEIKGGRGQNGEGGTLTIIGGEGDDDYKGGDVQITGGIGTDGPSWAGNVTITSGIANWNFENNGVLTLPAVNDEQSSLVGSRVIIGQSSPVTAPVGTPMTVYTPTTGVYAYKAIVTIKHDTGGSVDIETFEVMAANGATDSVFSVSNRLNTFGSNGGVNDTTVTTGAGFELIIDTKYGTTNTVTFAVTEFK